MSQTVSRALALPAQTHNSYVWQRTPVNVGWTPPIPLYIIRAKTKPHQPDITHFIDADASQTRKQRKAFVAAALARLPTAQQPPAQRPPALQQPSLNALADVAHVASRLSASPFSSTAPPTGPTLRSAAAMTSELGAGVSLTVEMHPEGLLVISGDTKQCKTMLFTEQIGGGVEELQQRVVDAESRSTAAEARSCSCTAQGPNQLRTMVAAGGQAALSR